MTRGGSKDQQASCGTEIRYPTIQHNYGRACGRSVTAIDIAIYLGMMGCSEI